MITEDKIKRQLELEQEYVQLGIDRYRKQALDKKGKPRPLSALLPGIALMALAIPPMVKALREFLMPARGGGRLQDTRRTLIQFNLEAMAFLTAQRCIEAIKTQEPIQRVALSIMDRILDNHEYNKFKAHEEELYKAAQAKGEKYVNRLMEYEKANKTKSIKHRRRALGWIKRNVAKLPDTVIPGGDGIDSPKFNAGKKLIELFITSTSLVELTQSSGRKGAGQGTLLLRGTQKVREKVNRIDSKGELLEPLHLPMIIPPPDWISFYEGGFLSNVATLRHQLIKTRDKKALAELHDHKMPEFVSALNFIQAVPWRINKRIYDVMFELYHSGNAIAGLPPKDDLPEPPKPWSSDEEHDRWKAEGWPSENYKKIRTWKKAVNEVHKQNVLNESLRSNLLLKKLVTEKMYDEEEIYFVWCADWRGRLYPVQQFVNPQSDDRGKGLIELKNGQPLTERGLWWLKVHAANCYGVDKVSFEDRVAWVDEHMSEIIDSAENPLDGERFWAKTKDDPFQFLAACFALNDHRKDPTSLCHVNVGMDGSCNGLQHFSALLRDPAGGAETNLIPADKPADIYSTVAKKAAEKVAQDAAEGNEMAQLWDDGKVDRSIAKPNCMTYGYGVTAYGMTDQLMDELKKRDTANKLNDEDSYLDCNGNYKPAAYLANVMWVVIGDTVIAAKEALEWFRQCASVLVKHVKVVELEDEDGKIMKCPVPVPIYWTTPIGFRARQLYKKQELKRIKTFWGSMKVDLNGKKKQETHDLGFNVETGKVNKQKMINALAPNVIHSLDASHMCMTVNALVDQGITDFGFVHDSYSVHPNHIDILNTTLREQFIKLYERDILEDFRQQLIAQLPPDLAAEIPPAPEKGDLDLEQVKHSRYFFA